jgi:DHA1 family tetracycline resistance protein-like MFS transporter
VSKKSASPREKAAKVPLPQGFGTIWLTVALDLVGFGIVVPILGRYAERFGASGLEVGLLFASFSLAQLVCAPLLGRLSDRIGRKPVIMISLLGTAVGSFVTGAAGALWVLFLGRILDGASGASVAVAQGAVTDLAPPSERPRLLGLLGAAFGVGFVIGPALGGLASLGGEHIPFFVAGTVALINAVVAWRRLPETRPADVRLAAREAAKNDTEAKVRLWGLAVAGFTAIVAFSGFEATFSLLAGDRFRLTEGGVAAIFVGVGIVLVGVQGGLIRPINARLGTQRSLQVGLVLNSAGLIVLSAAENWPLLIVALALLTVGQGLVTPNLSSLVSGRVPDHRRGEALGFQQGVNAIGRVAGPALAGVLYDHVSIGSPYLVGGALCGIALVLVVGGN